MLSAINGRQVEVEFNKAVDADSIKADNVKVYIGTSTTATTWTKNLSADKETLILGLDATIPQDTNVKVVINDVVADANANEKVSVEKTVKMIDITAPVIYNAVQTTSKTIVISTSEPLSLAAGTDTFHVLTNITIDGAKLVGKLTQDYAKNEITVELGSKLAVGDHTIVIDGYKDFAGFAAAKYEGTLKVVEDKTAPVMVSAEATTRDKVTVTFDEPVQSMGTITIAGTGYTTGVQSADKKSFTITLTGNKLGLASLVQETITYVGTTDMEGNSVTTSQKFTFVATDDQVAPTATIALGTGNSIVIKYSEPMSDAGKVTIKNSKGEVVKKDLVPVLDSSKDNKEATISALNAGFNSIASATSYTVELTAAKDASVRQNEIEKTTSVLTVADITAPRFVDAVITTPYAAGPPEVKAVVTVYFDEAMNVSTLSDMNNYLVDIDSTDATYAALQLSSITGAKAEVAADAKSVKLTIPKVNNETVSTNTKIYVLGVKDAAGNLISLSDFNVAKTVSATASTLTLTNQELIATNKVKLTFSNAISTVDPSNVKVYKNDGTSLAFVGIDYEINSNVVTVTLNGNLNANGYVDGDTGIAKVVVSSGSTKDVFGQVANIAATALVDKVAPTATKISTTDNTVFTIDLSESLANALDGTITSAEFVVLVDNVLDSSATIAYSETTGKITVTFGSAQPSGTKVNVKFYPLASSTIKDDANNILKAFDLSVTVD